MFPSPPPRNPTDPEQVDPIEDDPIEDDIDIIISDPVLRHRATRFADLGFNPAQSRALAIERSVDTHMVEQRLIDRGCAPDTAFLILL